jgi:hypothetical protein
VHRGDDLRRDRRRVLEDRADEGRGVCPGAEGEGGGRVEELFLSQRGGGAAAGWDRGEGDRVASRAEGAETGDEDEDRVEAGRTLVDVEAGAQPAQAVGDLRPGELGELGGGDPEERGGDGGSGTGEEGGRHRPVHRRLRRDSDVEIVQMAAQGQHRAVVLAVEVGELALQRLRRRVRPDREDRQPAALGGGEAGDDPVPLCLLQAPEQLDLAVAQQEGPRWALPGIAHRLSQHVRAVGPRRQLRHQAADERRELLVVHRQALQQLRLVDRRPLGHGSILSARELARGRLCCDRWQG